MDEVRTALRPGDIVAEPVNNGNYSPFKPELAIVREVLSVPGPELVATMRGDVGAGFYASVRGPLPFAFGWVPPEIVLILGLESATSTARPTPALR